MAKIAIHFIDRFEEIEGLTVVDVLRRADLEVIMVSVTGNKVVTGSTGIKIETDCLFEEMDYDQVDMVVLPGGPGTKRLSRHKGLNEVLLSFHEKNKKIGAICAAPFILGELGILNGKKAVCYPGFEEYLKGAILVNDKSVIDGYIVTGKGPGAAFDFAFNILKLFKDEEQVESQRKTMIVS